jgi:transcriptional regulator with XRE-family HTH domain
LNIITDWGIAMNIGETLKKLRREKDMTQEQLAEYLKISTQAVSKWETNLSLPDITLIPMLANILDTSADILLGIDITAKEKRIQDIVDRADKYLYTGYHVKATEIFRKGLKEYPNSYKIMNGLMNCVWKERDDQETEDKRTEMTNEVISLGEKILAGCTDDDLRHHAIQILCYTYPDVGETEKAVELAKKMPVTCLSSQNLLSYIYSGNKRFEIRRSNLLENIGSLILDMTCNSAPLDDGSRPHTTEELILIRKKVIAILGIMIEDENYGFYRQTMAWTYIDMAIFCARLKDYDSAIENLKLAAEHSIKNDEEYDPGRKYTCLLFRGMKFGGILYNIAENDSMHQLDEMKDSAFDLIRQNKDFIKIEEKLKKHAKKR